MEEQQELLCMQGTVEHVIYENRDTGYVVFEVNAGGELHVVTGTLGEINAGESVTIYGQFENHPTHGTQFKGISCEASMPQDVAATLAYLSSGALPYIGPATAKKIVETFGVETLEVIANDPARLTQLRGITAEKAMAISNEFRRMFGVREAVAYLGRFGISPVKAVQVYRTLGPKTVEAIQENPYLLCGEPLRLKFAQVDAMAIQMQQLAQDAGLRIQAGLMYVLRHNGGNGHTCLPKSQLVQTTAQFLQLEPHQVEQELEQAVERKELALYDCEGKGFVYLPELLRAEEDIAARLWELSRYLATQPDMLEQNIQVLEKAQGFAYAPEQRRAIQLALSSNVMVLTGGPGTGKTTTVNAILALFQNQAERVALCAPTGRAAKRLSELTGQKAQTIHRLLEVDYDPQLRLVRFIHNEKNLLKCDVVILDEMSMVDAKLFQSLLSALRHGCRIIMVGDSDQLPSVGPGNILSEVVRSGIVPTVSLTRIFRQQHQSMIVENAHRIVQGLPPLRGDKNSDFFFLQASGLACQQLVCDLVSHRLPKSYGLDPVRDIQVLCPTKRGPVGTVALNQRLQELLNPPAPEKPQLELGGQLFRLGDKVMQVKNNYMIPFERQGGEAGVGAFNGDMGIVMGVDPAERALLVQMDDRRLVYTADTIPELEIAYAVTVHKSQGSEFAAVVLPASDLPEKLCYRNLLYTGVTRAKKLCILAGRGDTVNRMVENVKQNLRYSCLADLLKHGALL
ncbi:MAG: ATP-dependent RecD-like DNA helicase [Candidatus Fournierella pullistercoris]|uniref:ATP-dependent RecD2 DNA helicase n=1 Tax=Candidatus Allofournierella pullistercoris TaxID=2838597 RepID=A0A948T370_9FIRM|nr:ATP-dependent RecD-like DNA helicase [Candidatus Fournierella pullistercoris]